MLQSYNITGTDSEFIDRSYQQTHDRFYYTVSVYLLTVGVYWNTQTSLEQLTEWVLFQIRYFSLGGWHISSTKNSPVSIQMEEYTDQIFYCMVRSDNLTNYAGESIIHHFFQNIQYSGHLIPVYSCDLAGYLSPHFLHTFLKLFFAFLRFYDTTGSC